MLILSRKLRDSIMINDYIHIKVLSIKGNTIKLGITAPTEVTIYREEIYHQLKNSGEESSESKKGN